MVGVNSQTNTPTNTNFVANGARNSTSEVLVDGAIVNTTEQNTGATDLKYTPSVDAVQEFKMQVNFFGAEFAESGGAIVNMVTKSGTNDFHGTAYYFRRDSTLNANSWSSNRSGAKKTYYRRDQPGAVVGGPIKKNKTFDGTHGQFAGRQDLPGQGRQHDRPKHGPEPGRAAAARTRKAPTRACLHCFPTTGWAQAPRTRGRRCRQESPNKDTIQLYRLLRNMPHFDGANGSEPNAADSWYHGLQVKVEKRFSKGLAMLAHYTWSKMMDDVSNGSGNLNWLSNSQGSNLQNPLDFRLEKSLSGNDVAHRFVGTGVYQLPFGQGKALAGT